MFFSQLELKVNFNYFLALEDEKTLSNFKDSFESLRWKFRRIL